jgi:FMN-dependent NADH-azoreductase
LRSYLSVSDELIAEVESADSIVIGAPMYNHTISAPLKAWIDQVVRMGKTMRYGADGPRGLLRNKRVVVITARGGAYEKGSLTEAFDFQAPYLRHVLGAIGLSDVTFIHAEKQGRPDAEMAVAAASAQISRIVREQRQAAVQTQTNY